jgi:hypothetical protein
MKKKEFLFGFSAVLLALALVLAGCSTDDNNNGSSFEDRNKLIFIEVGISHSKDLVNNYPPRGTTPATSMSVGSIVVADIAQWYTSFHPDYNTIKYEWYKNGEKIEGVTGMKLDTSPSGNITVAAGDKIKARITIDGTITVDGKPETHTASAYSQEIPVIAAPNG